MMTKEQLKAEFEKKLASEQDAFNKQLQQRRNAFEICLHNLTIIDSHLIEISELTDSANTNYYLAKVLDLKGYDKAIIGCTHEEAITNMRQAIAKFKGEKANV